MKHLHLLIIAGRVIDSSARFYKVAVGCSKQSDRDYLYLTAYAASTGAYFERWGENTCEFLRKIDISIYGEPDSYQGIRLQVLHVDARDMVRALKSATLPAPSSDQLANTHYMRSVLDSNYLFHSRINGKKQSHA